MTTATYFSGRSGEVTVGVASIRKNLSSMRMSDYVPDYSETSSVGKRMLLLPDEVLRFPLDQALVIIQGQKVLKVRKFDYSRHPEAKRLVLEKTESHVPQWRKGEVETGNEENELGDVQGESGGRDTSVKKPGKSENSYWIEKREEKPEESSGTQKGTQRYNKKPNLETSERRGNSNKRLSEKEDVEAHEEYIALDSTKRIQENNSYEADGINEYGDKIERVEDLFTDDW